MEWVEKAWGEQEDPLGGNWMRQEEVTVLGEPLVVQWDGWRKVGWLLEVCQHVEV